MLPLLPWLYALLCAAAAQEAVPSWLVTSFGLLLLWEFFESLQPAMWEFFQWLFLLLSAASDASEQGAVPPLFADILLGWKILTVQEEEQRPPQDPYKREEPMRKACQSVVIGPSCTAIMLHRTWEFWEFLLVLLCAAAAEEAGPCLRDFIPFSFCSCVW